MAKNRTKYFKIVSGEGVEFEFDAQEKITQGMRRPKASEVVRLPVGLFGSMKRIVLYPDGHPTPWPVSEQVVRKPDEFGAADLDRLQGPYLSGLIRRAMKLDEKLNARELWTLILAGATALFSLGGLIAIIYGFHKVGVW